MHESTAIPPRDKRNVSRYIAFMFVWALVYVGCTFVLEGEYIPPGTLRWLIALVPSLAAAAATAAYWHYLRELDELLRAIELKALALSASAGFVVWPAIELIEGSVPFDVKFPVVLLVMVGFYSYGCVKGRLDHL